jgi:uncharacterized protein YidB (DUF937 family)
VVLCSTENFDNLGREIMGLLDGVLGAVLGGGNNNQGGQQDVMSAVIGGLIQQAGGVGGLLGMLKQGGLGQQADSWQGTGQNMPVEGGDLMKVLGGMMGGASQQQASAGGMGAMGGLLGSVLGGGQGGAGGNLGDLLSKSGIGQDQLGGLLAQVLPGVLDGMTPGGQVPQAHDNNMMQDILGSVLKNAMGGKGGGLFG